MRKLDSERLTPKQRAFCQEYVACQFNGAEAYMRTHNTDNRKSASVQASKLLRLPKVAEYVQKYAQEVAGPREKSILGNIKLWEQIRDDENARAADRLKASENLAKWAEMFLGNRSMEETERVQIVDDIS